MGFIFAAQLLQALEKALGTWKSCLDVASSDAPSATGAWCGEVVEVHQTAGRRQSFWRVVLMNSSTVLICSYPFFYVSFSSSAFFHCSNYFFLFWWTVLLGFGIRFFFQLRSARAARRTEHVFSHLGGADRCHRCGGAVRAGCPKPLCLGTVPESRADILGYHFGLKDSKVQYEIVHMLNSLV